MDPRSLVNQSLARFLAEQRIVAAKADPAGLAVIDELVRVVSAGGKRLRPMFCYWGHLVASGSHSDRIVRAAGSLELLHTFAIIHDDFMDRSAVRRGIPASHVAFGGGHWGASAAILAGDLAFVLADRMLVESGFDPALLLAAFDWFNQMRVEVVVGQFADMAAARDGADEPAARRIAVLKSGSYTVEKPLAIGACLAGATPDTIEALSAFGRPLGEAFQLRDDVLGAFGSAARTGKDAASDFRQGKATVLIAKARALATPEQVAVLDVRLGDESLDDAGVEAIREVIRSTGALAETNTLISSLHRQALAALAEIDCLAEAREALSALSEIVTQPDA